ESLGVGIDDLDVSLHVERQDTSTHLLDNGVEILPVLLFLRPRVAEGLEHFVESDVEVLEAFSKIVVGAEARDEVGVPDRFEESRELAIRLADKAKQFRKLKPDDHHHEQGRKHHVRPGDHKGEQGHRQSEKHDSQDYPRAEVLKIQGGWG